MRTTLLLGFVLSVFAVGCDTGGFADLREKRDTLVSCAEGVATTTWVRSISGATEILVLGSPDPLAVVPSDAPSCYALAQILYNSETTLETGSYSMDGTHVGQFVHADEYYFPFQPSTPILGRAGATRTTLAPPSSESWNVRMEGSTLVVTIGGQDRRFTSLAQVIDTAQTRAATQAGAEDIFRLFNLPLFSSQVRLLGFGSGSMTQYARITARFNGLIKSYFTVNVESPTAPTTHIDYYQFEDLTGIIIDGRQDTIVGINAKGTMAGVLSYVMVGTAGPAAPAIRGSVDYRNLIINNGMAGGGTYEIAIQGQPSPFTIDYTLATNIDLRGVLPIAP